MTDAPQWKDELDHNGATVVDRLIGNDVVQATLAAVADAGEGLTRRGGGGFGRRNVLDVEEVAAVARHPAGAGAVL